MIQAHNLINSYQSDRDKILLALLLGSFPWKKRKKVFSEKFGGRK
jgi:hypothetical protein